MPETMTPEGAVRSYLLYLDDPSKLIDQSAVKKAEAAAAKASDPMARLRALADLEHVREADGDQLREAFVAHAKAYADEQRIPASAFREMGVPSDVLGDAGFGGGRGRRPGARGKTATGAPRVRAPRVPLEQIKGATGRLSNRFTLSDLGEKAGGGSPATLRKAVDEMIAEGRVTKIGPMENYSGRGRAPTVYQLS